MTELESKSEKLDLPFSAHRFEAPSKKFAETIILVPFYGARSTSLKRHVELFNRLGYDVVTFHLYQETRSLSGPLFSSAGQFGFKHIWADQIEVLLNCFPGPKLFFLFRILPLAPLKRL